MRNRHLLLFLLLDQGGLLGVIRGGMALSGQGDFLAFIGRSLIRVNSRSEGHVIVEGAGASLLKRDRGELTLKVVFVRLLEFLLSVLFNVLFDILRIFVEETPLVLP
jgi:hypothetical protein